MTNSDDDHRIEEKTVEKEKQWSKDLKASLGAAEILCQMIYRLVDENHELYRMAKSLDMCLTDFYDSRAKAIAEEFGDWIKKVNEDCEIRKEKENGEEGK